MIAIISGVLFGINVIIAVMYPSPFNIGMAAIAFSMFLFNLVNGRG